jgi:predicted SprT family Zn-dependent metalloprotease
MNLAETEALAVETMQKYGLIERGWRFFFDRAIYRWGACHYKSKRITLSKAFTQAADLAAVKDTILHEIAHALTGAEHAHDADWKHNACALGCTPSRCNEPPAGYRPKPKWIGTCPGCGREIERHVRSGISCGVCSPGQYDPGLAFTWRERGSQHVDPWAWLRAGL